MNGFTEALRQEVTQRYVRVGVLEPGGVATELGSHNTPKIRDQMIDPFYQQTEVLAPEDIADGIAYLITRPATPRSANCGSCPPSKSDRIPAHRKSAKSRSIREPNSDSRSHPARGTRSAHPPARKPLPCKEFRPFSPGPPGRRVSHMTRPMKCPADRGAQQQHLGPPRTPDLAE